MEARQSPWTSEPDRVEFRHAGFACLIKRNGMGALCGYVGVEPGHPWHDKAYVSLDVEVHGGLTYGSPCQETEDESDGICHVPEPGAPDDVWWFGFDCAHAFDMCPITEMYRQMDPTLHVPPYTPTNPAFRDVYRDVAYVVGECQRLAEQLESA